MLYDVQQIAIEQEQIEHLQKKQLNYQNYLISLAKIKYAITNKLERGYLLIDIKCNKN